MGMLMAVMMNAVNTRTIVMNARQTPEVSATSIRQLIRRRVWQ